MAIYHLHAKTWSKGAGQGAGGHARYVLRQGPYAKRVVERVDGSAVQRVAVDRAAEVVASYSGHLPAWAEGNPLAYWDAADAYERANGTVYRELEFALPMELSERRNLELAQAFAEALARVDRGATPYTLVLHRSARDPELLHCHLMLSDRVNDGYERSPELWFRRAANRGKDPARGGAPKTQARIAQDWLGTVVRPLWAELANAALEQARCGVRIDHRSLDAQRRERELLAEQAQGRGDELAAARYRKSATILDRPAQPKRGRVLEHGGPGKAPGQALVWERYQEDLVRRRAARERLAEAEGVVRELREEIARERRREERRAAARRELDASHGWRLDRVAMAQEVLAAVLGLGQAHRQDVRERWTDRQRERIEREDRRQKLRELAELLQNDSEATVSLPAAYRAAGYRLEAREGKRVWIYPHADLHVERQAVAMARKAWNTRRQERVLDAATRAERRNGFRAPDPDRGNPARPSWAVYRERVLTEAYGAEVGRALGRWVQVDIDRRSRSLRIHNRAMELTDYGDRVVAGMGGTDKEIAAMLQIAGAKGWTSLTVTGSADFQLRAGAAALAAGFTLVDRDLVARITARQEAEVEAQRARDVGSAPLLAEWMRSHPKQAHAQRLAGGKIPFACPDGLDRRELQRDALWVAADAWSVGRYGTDAEIEALKRGPDPLKVQAVAAGREAAYNAWAQNGLTLKVGRDAPEGRGIAWTLSGKVTREAVERYAGIVQDRRARAGVEHGVTVTFSQNTADADKVLVLEHLLRQSVPLDAQALEQAGDGWALDRARERLKTHEADGRPQAWYIQQLERDRLARQREAAAKIRAEREAKLDGLVVHLERNGTRDAGRYFTEAGFERDREGHYFYPDPELPGVRKAWEALALAQRKEYEADIQRRADALGYRLERGRVPDVQRGADAALRQLVAEVKDDPALRELVDTAYGQGVSRARREREAQREQERKALRVAAHNLGPRAEAAAGQGGDIQRAFAELVRRGAELGVDEKGLSRFLRDGRVAYRQELARSRGPSLGR